MGGHAEIFVGRLSDRLISHFGKANIFLDVINIPVGRDFDKIIEEKIAQSDAVLAMIGPDWLAELKQRENHQNDFVRAELKVSLNRKIPVIPVLMGNVSLPSPDTLPLEISDIAKKQAFAMDLGIDFHDDVTALIEELESMAIPTFIDHGSFRAIKEDYSRGNTLRFQVLKSGEVMSYGQVLDHWVYNHEFRDFYCELIQDSGLTSYVWETPPLTINHLDRAFEFVLLNIPIWSASPDTRTYEKFFDENGGDHGVIFFDNLGKDALLVVPSPLEKQVDYSNLAAFLTNAPNEQKHALWRTVGVTAKRRLSENPLWISVAGGGIAWLHIRLDSHPKYYRYGPYQITPSKIDRQIEN